MIIRSTPVLAALMVCSTAVAQSAPAAPELSKSAQKTPKADPYASQVARSQLRERAIDLLVKSSVDREPVLRAKIGRAHV